MEIDYVWDKPEYVIGQISALKKLGYSDRLTADTIKEWGFEIHCSTVNRIFNRFENCQIENNWINSGRPEALN